MKILVVCQHYYPEPFRITDICEELVEQGNEVTVITGIPNYPMGKIYDGYRCGKKRDEIINGVKIHRCFEIGRRSGILFRFLNYYSFALSSKRYVKRLKEKYDVVLANQLSPVMMSEAAVKYKKKYGGKLVLYCLDLWPESLTAGGIKRGSFIYRYYHKVSAKIYGQADKILITSKMFKKYFIDEFGAPEEKISYLPQYAEDIFKREECEKEPDGTIDLMFAGNIGSVQSVETIIKAAHEIRDIENLRWHIVGDGSDLENCKKLADDLGVKSVTFYGRKPVEDMPKYYKMADAMLVTLINDPILAMTLPGKVQTYMAAGKPIIGAIDGEAAESIKESGCGYCGRAENVEELTENVRRFCEKANERRAAKFSENAVVFYNKHFKKECFFEVLNQNLAN